MNSASPASRNIMGLSVGLLIAAGLYVARLHSYLLFHSLAEVLTVALACSVFLVTWNAREFDENGYFLIVGVGGLFASGLEVVHLLAYRGMGVLAGAGTDLPTQLWIAARALLAATLIIAPLYAGRRADHRIVFAGFAAAVAFLGTAVARGWFPQCYVEGAGLTPFKIYAEYVIAAGFLASAALLARKTSSFDPQVLTYSVLAMIASAFAELSFTLYKADVYGWLNMVGHYLALASFYLMYEAVVGTELVRKYALHERLAEELRERERAEETVRRLASFPLLNPNPVLEIDSSGRVVFLNPSAKRILSELGRAEDDGRALLPAPAEALFAEAANARDVPIYREIVVGGRHFALTAKLAAPFDLVRIYALEITRRVQAGERMRQKAEIIEGINRIFQEAPRCRSDEELARVCLSVAERLTASAFGFVGEIGPDGVLRNLALSDPGWEQCAIQEKPEHGRAGGAVPGRGLDAGVIAGGRTLLTNDPAGHPDSAGTPPGHPRLTSFLGAPLSHAGTTIGMVGLGNREGGYRAEDAEALEALCAPIVQALMERRASEALRVAKEGLEARVEERTRDLTQINEELRREVQARRAAEESLGRTAEFLRAVEASMRAGVSVVDPEGRYIYVNPAFCRIVGWREEELLGQGPPYPFWPPEDNDRLRRIHDAAMRGESPPGGIEARYRRRTGEAFDALSLPSALMDDRGRITGRMTVVYDITERKEGERALLEANEKLNALIESSPLAIVVRGLDDRVTVWNPAAERMFEWRREEVIGRPMPIIPPESEGDYRRLRDAILRGEELRRIEFRRARKDGSPVDVGISTALLRDVAGNVTGIIAIFEDVTERKRMQEELAESEKRFRSLVENSPAALCLVRNGRIFFTNPEMERIFGAIPPGFEFRHYKGVAAEDREKFERLCDALERPDPPTLEVDVRFVGTAQGARRALHWLHVRTAGIEYHGGQATLVSLMDITRLKELEHLARTREKMASLGHVAAGIAHEIRNPLSGLNIYMSNLGKVCETSDGFEPENKALVGGVLEQMRSASAKIESVIRRVMDFTRPHPVKLVPADINAAVEEAVALSQVFLRKQGVRLAKALDEGLPRVPADVAMIEQVILNLLTNAVQAMQDTPGRREIEIASFREDDAVVVSVADSGPGVPLEIRDKIFDPFYTTRSDGSGIGLSICHRVVSDHGGVLSVRTGKWGGAEFRVALPLSRSAGS